ncbi:hypothetical protein [Cryobacterium ruanii]|uniref:Uncharacterized protein n=1 Tax=Cryobacterium ruanii TaxID=1259197 RepID=A0A4R9AJV2_9MICO|nr:hypothetical protein [Cryobacterium ruanii]TFD62973.1 hypothetical protein E3T47_14910 [Cryobacterium ruanii]
MERMTRVTGEIIELVYSRLGRGADAHSENESDRAFRHGQAELAMHAMLGVRFMAAQWMPAQDCAAGSDADTGRNTADHDRAPTLAESLSRTIEVLRRSLCIPGL